LIKSEITGPRLSDKKFINIYTHRLCAHVQENFDFPQKCCIPQRLDGHLENALLLVVWVGIPSWVTGALRCDKMRMTQTCFWIRYP